MNTRLGRAAVGVGPGSPQPADEPRPENHGGQQAEQALNEALTLVYATGSRFMQPAGLGRLAQITTDPETRNRALREGWEMLETVGGSMNWVEFLYSNIDVAFQQGRWRVARERMDRLFDDFRDEPFPFLELMKRCVYTIAALGEAGQAPEDSAEWQALRTEVADLHLNGLLAVGRCPLAGAPRIGTTCRDYGDHVRTVLNRLQNRPGHLWVIPCC